MSAVAIILIVISAFIHASWNLVSKRNRPTAAFFLVGNTVGCLILCPAVIAYGHLYAAFSPRIVLLLVATGWFQALYFSSLAGAYRSGEMSLAYPLARSSPLIVVTVVTFFLGRRDQLSGQCVAGVLLIVAGCFLVPMSRFREFRPRDYFNATCGLALLAAFGTAGYSIVDDDALRTLRAAVEPGLWAGVKITVLYAFAEAVFASTWLALFIVSRKAGRRDLRQTIRTGRRAAALAGVGIYTTYTLVLVAMAFARNVSYVVAFRQLSIPLGAIFGMVALKESHSAPKILGIIILFAGLILVGTG